LLISRQLQVGQQIDAAAVCAALLSTARACDPAIVDEPERCLRGVIDLPAAFDALFGSRAGIGASGRDDRPVTRVETVPQISVIASVASWSKEETLKEMSPPSTTLVSAVSAPTSVRAAGGVEQSTAHSGLVYALGSLSYDFGSEIGRQEFEQYMNWGGGTWRPGTRRPRSADSARGATAH
jgi:thiazoline dehydrogenase / protease